MPAIALRGAVILNQDGNLVTYKEKCESCGHVSPGERKTSIDGWGTYTSAFRCFKCGTNQKGEIRAE